MGASPDMHPSLSGSLEIDSNKLRYLPRVLLPFETSTEHNTIHTASSSTVHIESKESCETLTLFVLSSCCNSVVSTFCVHEPDFTPRRVSVLSRWTRNSEQISSFGSDSTWSVITIHRTGLALRTGQKPTFLHL